MANNGYLKKREVRNNALLDIGSGFGAQKVIDFLTLVLRDPEYVGNDIFGRERIDLVIAGIHNYDKEFSEAFTTRKEADVAQAHLDQMLKEVYGDELCQFRERYPFIRQLDYKPRKEWNA